MTRFSRQYRDVQSDNRNVSLDGFVNHWLKPTSVQDAASASGALSTQETDRSLKLPLRDSI